MEDLAAAGDVSVDTVRYYQARGLLPSPERQGRVAWYGEAHLERLRQIRALQRQGLTLALIEQVLAGGWERPDRDLALAVASARAEDGDDEELLTPEELSRRCGVPLALLEAAVREGFQVGRQVHGEWRYTQADVEMVRLGLTLLEAGLPLAGLLALGREHDEAMRVVAERAVQLFDDHVRKPLRASAGSEEEAAARLVEAFERLLPAITAMVAHHFRRVLLETAECHLQAVGARPKAVGA